MSNRKLDPPENGCSMCTAWYAEAQRALFLLEALASDHFPDRETFEAWTNRQVGLALRKNSE